MKDEAEQTRNTAGERRLVTIMFADLVGSTVLSQQLDPEDYAEVVLDYQAAAREVIERNGGVVANYSGDGVVGQFGYPEGHENDAERAVVSGLEICSRVLDLDATLGAELGVRIACRVGLHASVSVVGVMGAYRQDMSIFGDTANIASRVEGVANAGQVVATANVIDLLHGDFEIADEQFVDLKGIAEPVKVARIVRRAPNAMLASPTTHVGRGGALDELADRWVRAERGEGSLVTISAEAGTGKSALTHAFLRRLAGDAVPVVGARGRELTLAQPFGVLEQLADATGERFDRSSPPGSAARAVTHALAVSEHLGMSAEERWQQIFDAGLHCLETLAGERVVVVVEDLHWTDSSTQELLERFAKRVDELPCLVITTTRPGPHFGAGASIELEPLSDEEMRVLVLANAAVALPERIVDDIVRRAEGVPLFAVELARGATADSTAALPDSLQASLLSRLAHRPDVSRIAQVASIIGDVIDVSLLAALLETDTAELSDSLAVLDADHVLEIDAAGTCQFTHSLLREAIYASMLRRERRGLHRAAAAALTDAGARDDHRLSVVGHHLALGAQRLEAASCYDTAARRAAALGAFHDAVDLAEQGISVLGEDASASNELLGLLMTKGNALFATVGYAAPGLFELWRQAEHVAEQVDNRLEQSSGMNGQSVAALFDAKYELAIARADRIVALGESHDDRPALVRGHCSRAIPQLYLGQVVESLANAERAIELSRPGDYELLTYGFGTDHLAIAASTAATAAYFAADERYGEFSELAIDHARRISSPISQAMVHNNAATLALLAEDPDRALVQVEHVWSLCDRYGLPFFRLVSTLTKAAALAISGDASATQLAYGALGNAEVGSNLALSLGVYSVARCEEAAGNLDGAYDLAETGLGVVASQSERLLEVELLLMQMRCRPSDDAISRLTSSLPIAHTRGAQGSIMRAEQALDVL